MVLQMGDWAADAEEAVVMKGSGLNLTAQIMRP
jgi:hypothetical protein